MKIFKHPHGITLTISKIVLTIIEKNVRTAQAIPRLPILSAITSSFFYNGVGSFSFYVCSVILPEAVFGPTVITIAVPVPETTRDLARSVPISYMLSAVISCLTCSSGSPVRSASTQERSYPEIISISAGTFIPDSM